MTESTESTESSRITHEQENKVGGWKKLGKRIRNAVAAGKNILDQKAQQHKENKEKNSLEYRVREAVAETSQHPIDTVEMDSTFEDLGLFLDGTPPDTTKFEMVVQKLGLTKLDFTITATATVADIVIAVKAQKA